MTAVISNSITKSTKRALPATRPEGNQKNVPIIICTSWRQTPTFICLEGILSFGGESAQSSWPAALEVPSLTELSSHHLNMEQSTSGRHPHSQPHKKLTGFSHQRELLAQSLLTAGYPSAFADFFSISAFGAGNKWVRENVAALQQLILKAHSARATGDNQEAYAAYCSLGEQFALNGLNSPARKYYTTCLTLAEENNWPDGQLNANLNIGLLCQHMGEWGEAESRHRRHLELAQLSNNAAEAEVAHANLVQVFREEADEARSKGDGAATVGALRRCVAAAQHGQLDAAHQEVTVLLGLALHQQGQFQEASATLEPCTRLLDDGALGLLSPDEIAGICAWADCQVKLGRIDAAVGRLQQLVDVCQKNGDISGEAQARCNLGVTQYLRGTPDVALTQFQRCVSIAQTNNDKALLRLSMVNAGAALASKSVV